MFSSNSLVRFELFSLSHSIVIGLFFIGMFCLYFFRRRIQNNRKLEKYIKWTFLSILIVSEASFQIWSISTGMWDKRNYIPIELCSLSTYLTIYVFLSNNKKAFNILYFIGLLPPALAVITPDLTYGFPHFIFIRFFLQHMVIAWSVLFFVFISQYRPRFKNVFQTFLYLNIYAVPVYLINGWIGANYMFLGQAPTSTTPLSWLGEPPFYLINLEFLTLTLFLLLYVPFALEKRRKLTLKRG